MKKFLIISIVVFLLIGFGISPFEALLDQNARDKLSKIEQSKQPLTVDQVTAFLGKPTSIETAETTGIRGEVYHYHLSHSLHEMRVIFVNGIVFRTQYLPDGL